MVWGDISLEKDPRWERLTRSRWLCTNCEEPHEGIFDLGCMRPEAWPDGEDDIKPNGEARHSKHFLSEDFCVLRDEHFFVRCVLMLPILGAPNGEHFGYGVWSTLSRKNFGLYLEGFDSGAYGDTGSWFGWFSNRLKGYEPATLNLKCQVHPQERRQRPLIKLEATDHPLAIEAREGITLDRLLELYKLNGHEMRV